MYNSFLWLAVLAGSIGSAAAQTTEPSAPPANPASDSVYVGPRLLVGLTLGPLASSFLGSDATTGQSAQYRPGFHAGLMADIGLGDSWAFHPEVLYVEKGASYDQETRRPDLRLRYVELPLLARRYFAGTAGTQAFFAEAGPRVSALLAADQSDTGADLFSDFRRVDAGFLLGAGYRTAAGFAIGLRYDVSITPAYKTMSPESSLGRGNYQPNHRNDAYFVSVSFPLLGSK